MAIGGVRKAELTKVRLVSKFEMVESDPVIGPAAPASATIGAQFDIVVKFLRRRYLSILIGLLLALPFGALYVYITPATYTAAATMMIESRKGPLEPLLGNSSPDPAWIDSQIGVLRSLNIASYIVKQLRLADDPEFIRSGETPLDKLLARFGWGPPEPKTEPERVSAAIGALSNGLEVKRVGGSYLMRIEFRSENQEQAVKIANAVIDGYIVDGLNAKYQSNRRTVDWLQERLQALREQAASAERAVLEFKTKNNLVAAGGSLINEKELAQMSDKLAAARSQLSDLQIRLQRIEAVRQAYQQDRPASAADENVTEAMNNSIMGGLRSKYLDLVNREADWSSRYGKNHTAVVNLRNQIRDLRKSMRDELGRIEETSKSEYEIAKKKQDEAEKQVAGLISQSGETNQARVALFSLEATAQSYRRLYDSFLQRYTESVQSQTFPASDARAISPAGATRTGLKSLKIWLTTVFVGGMLGAGLGVFRELMDRGFRTREQVRSVLATECLALVPLLTDGRRKKFLSHRPFLTMEPMRNGQFAVARGAVPRSISSGQKIIRTMIDSPSSPYAEAVRSLKLTVDLSSKPNVTNVVGLTSCLASEGKSSLAAAMASLIAQGGARVIVVDCDVRNPSLSRALAPESSAGFLDVVAGKVELENAIWRDPTTDMAFLPAGQRVPNASEILASDKAKLLFDALQIKYDYVIVDLAPLAAGVDVRATASFIDSYVLVIEWGATKIDAVQYALRNAPSVHANIVGAVLNKVDMAAMNRYDSHGCDYYYGQSREVRAQ
jgi:succinoglycan biosynthesis transport protein ExoP